MALNGHKSKTSYLGQFKKDQDGQNISAGIGQLLSEQNWKLALREGYIDENDFLNGWGRAIYKEDGSVEVGFFKNSVMESGQRYFSDGTSIRVGQEQEECSD